MILYQNTCNYIFFSPKCTRDINNYFMSKRVFPRTQETQSSSAKQEADIEPTHSAIYDLAHVIGRSSNRGSSSHQFHLFLPLIPCKNISLLAVTAQVWEHFNDFEEPSFYGRFLRKIFLSLNMHPAEINQTGQLLGNKPSL